MLYVSLLIIKKISLYSRLENGKPEPAEIDSLKRELLETTKCYILDRGAEVYVWMGRNTSLDDRKSASGAAEVPLLTFYVVMVLDIKGTSQLFTDCWLICLYRNY